MGRRDRRRTFTVPSDRPARARDRLMAAVDMNQQRRLIDELQREAQRGRAER